MRKFAGVLAVTGLSLSLLAGLLVAVQAEGRAPESALSGKGDPPAVSGLSTGLIVTETHTVYQPLAAKNSWGFVMYADDFSDPGSGWHIGEMLGVRWSYQSGEYEILLSAARAYAAVTAPFQGVDDFAFEFDVRREGGNDNLYGAVFGWVDGDHFYVFAVAPDDQYYGVYRVSGGTWQAVIPWNTSAHIQPGDASNHLRIERSGDQLAVYANGNMLADATDDSYTGPLQAGFYAESGEAIPVAARYDNVLITQLKSGMVLGAAVPSDSEARVNLRGNIDLLPTSEAETITN